MREKLANYIPISRKLFSHVFFSEPRVFSKFEAWIDLLQEARYDVKERSLLIGGKIIKIKRGEIPASLRYLAERWQWSKNKVDSFIKLLESEGMIVKRTAQGTAQTVITICKYEDYNAIEKSERTADGTRPGQGRDSIGTGSGQNSNIVNKENKEEKDVVYTTEQQSAFSSFQTWIDQNASNVGKLKEPFTIHQFVKLKEKVPSTSEITSYLVKMHNWKDLTKKNVSAYLTFLTWYNRDQQK